MPAPDRCRGQAAAGTQSPCACLLDSRFRGNDARPPELTDISSCVPRLPCQFGRARRPLALLAGKGCLECLHPCPASTARCTPDCLGGCTPEGAVAHAWVTFLDAAHINSCSKTRRCSGVRPSLWWTSGPFLRAGSPSSYVGRLV